MERATILAACQARFDLGSRKVDDMLKGLDDYLKKGHRGHAKVFEIDIDTLAGMEEEGRPEWYQYLASVETCMELPRVGS